MNRGENNHKWRGGKTTHSNGYPMTRKPDHPRAMTNGYICDHILVAEKALDKSLPLKAVVHHYTKDQLVICQDQAYHLLLHQRQKAYEACGHANWLKCRICHQYDRPENLYLYKGKLHGHHIKCNKLYCRQRWEFNRNFTDEELNELINMEVE